MLFNSLHFLIFFPVVVIFYYSLKQKYRWILLLLASYYFYMSWKAEYVILIMISTLVDYLAGIRIHSSKSTAMKKAFLALSITVNLGLLVAFKYFNFLSDSLRDLLSSFAIQLDPFTLKVLLPVGISFYTFQTLSYTIDIYRGKIRPERHLGIFAVFVAFFPQLIAGPIERAKNLIPQLRKKVRFSPERAKSGLVLMLWGFFKKVVIADRLALFVDLVYNNVPEYTAVHYIIATLFFGIQIYCDFSGYTDIARGAARVMGINLMKNFNLPYSARSLRGFWKRWHISLTSWFKDYLYIPLGGSKIPVPRWYLNIMIVFVISGLWHGADWTFILWGFFHGSILLLSSSTRGLRDQIIKILRLDSFPSIHDAFRLAITFATVNIGWVFFRAGSISTALNMIKAMFTPSAYQGGWDAVSSMLIRWNSEGLGLGIGRFELYVALASIAVLEAVQYLQARQGMKAIDSRPVYVRWLLYAAAVCAILVFGQLGQNAFIYFQF